MIRKFLLVLLSVSLVFTFSCQKETRSFTDLVPADSRFFMTLHSLDSLTGIAKGIVGQRGSFFKAMVGFDPLSSEDLKEFGIDPQREFGLFFSRFDMSGMKEKGKPEFTMAFGLPVQEGKDLVASIESMIAEKQEGFSFQKEGDAYRIPAPGAQSVLMQQIEGYLFIAAGEGEEPAELLQKIGKESISGEEIYQKVSMDGERPSIFLFANFDDGEFFSKMFSTIQETTGEQDFNLNMAEWFKGMRSAAIAVDFKSPDLIIRGKSLTRKDAPVNSLQKSVVYDIKPLISVDQPPALIASFGLNLSRYMEMMKKSFGQEQFQAMDVGLKELEETLGINLFEDVINNLGGNFNLGVYNLSELKSMKINALMTMSLKSPEKISGALEKLQGLAIESKKFTLKEEIIADTPTITMAMGPVSLYIGVKDSLIVSSNLDVYKQALGGTPESGFVPKLKDPVLKDHLKNPNTFYLDMDQALMGMQGLSAFMGQKASEETAQPVNQWIETASRVMKEFDYILTHSEFTPEVKSSRIIVKSRFSESFFTGIKKLVEEIKAEAAQKEKEAQSTETDEPVEE